VVRVFNTVVIVADRVHLSPSCGGERIKARDDAEEPASGRGFALHKGMDRAGARPT
jgi:hypothetical protein